MPSSSRTVSFTCRGHGAIAGTHDKTLELTRATDLTRRATCVVGVGSDHDDDTLLGLRGEIEIVLECAEHRDALTATVTPFFTGDDSLVVRRGPELRGRTFAYDATKTAHELDRDLVRELATPDATVRVTITETGRGMRTGALFVVSVPIGNDDDLSPRARRVVEAADVVLAEDTRRFRDLVQRTGMHTRADVLSYYDQNERARAGDAVARLHAGARVALVSDAGTPLCSDPGYVVVHDAVAAGIPVSPVPGPSSLLAVLAAAGLPVDRFLYAGFLSRRSAARRREIEEFAGRGDAFVVHEAPHRVHALLDDLAAVVPEWQLCVGREVTKVFEEFCRGTAHEVAAMLRDAEARGEYTIVVAPPIGYEVAAADDEHVDRLVRELLAAGVTTKTLALALATLPGVSRKEAYARVLAIAERA